MTLRMVAEYREDYGYSNHFDMRMYCDWCGERIRDLRDGLYCWRNDPVTWICIDGTIHHLHTDCWAGFVAANSGDWEWAWERMLDLHMNLLGSLRPQDVRARRRARGHLDDVLYPDAGEPGSEFRSVTRQESERWAQEHPTIQLKEGQVYEAAVLLRRIDRAKQEMDETLGELLRQLETDPDAESPGEDVDTQESDDQAAD